MNSARQLLSNTAANWAGQLLPPVLALVMVPLYLAHLGMAAYGLIGAFAALTTLLNVFSQGISQALQREFARRNQDEGQRRTMRPLARRFERVYLACGAGFGIIIAASANWIGSGWIRDGSGLSLDEIETAVRLLGARIAISFPYAVYSAVFIGTQRQVRGNAYAITFALLGALTGAALVVGTKSITALYAGEVLVAAGMVFAARRASFRILPPEETRDDKLLSRTEARALIRLSSGMVWTSGIGVIVTQIDRILLSRLTALAELAVYNAAAAGGRLIGLVYMPYLTAAFPRTCRLVAVGDTAGLTMHIMQNAAIVASITAAIGMPVIFFSGDLLWLWTRNALIRDAGASLMAIYILGSLALSNAAVFYMLQMAAGSVRPAVFFNSAALIWYPAVMLGLIARQGAAGAAWTWMLYGCSCWLYMAASSFRRQLSSRTWRPYVRCAVAPYVFAAAVSAAAAHALPISSTMRGLACVLLAAALVPSALFVGLGRREFGRLLHRLRARGESRAG